MALVPTLLLSPVDGFTNSSVRDNNRELMSHEQVIKPFVATAEIQGLAARLQ